MAPAPKQAQHPAQDPDVDSDDSNATRIITFEDVLDEIQEIRERKVVLGGRLSRPIKQYRKEDIRMHPPRPGMWDNPEDAYYSMYLFLERKYWDGERRAWESFLTRIQRRWQTRNDAAGGTIPPPPPLQDMDPVELYTEYLELVHGKVQAGAAQGAENPFSGGWVFGDYALLLDHSEAMERVLEEIRKERGLTDQALTGEEDHGETRASLASESHSGASKQKRPQGDDSEEVAAPQAGPASEKTRTQKSPTAASRRRKRAHDDEVEDDGTTQAGRASKKARPGQSRAPAPRKQNVGGSHADNTTSTSAAGARDVPNKPPRATSRRVREKEVQAKTTTKSKSRPKKSSATAPDSRPSTGRMRTGKDIGGPSTGSSRRSRRVAGLKPENGGL